MKPAPDRYISVHERRASDGIMDYYVVLDLPYFPDYLCGRVCQTRREAQKYAKRLASTLRRLFRTHPHPKGPVTKKKARKSMQPQTTWYVRVFSNGRPYMASASETRTVADAYDGVGVRTATVKASEVPTPTRKGRR